jgi:hypothetical protein
MTAVVLTAIPANVSAAQLAVDRIVAVDDDTGGDAADRADAVSTIVVDAGEEEEHLPATLATFVAQRSFVAHFDSYGAPFASERSRPMKPPRA